MFNKFIQSQKSKFVTSIFMAILSVGILSGCQSLESNSDKKQSDEIMMCTMQYEPVCATVEIDGQKIKKQFGNDCVMGNFRDGKILSSSQGACQ